MHPLVEKMLAGDKRALARLMTFVDNRHEELMDIMTTVYAHQGHAYRIGVTGPPGAGKSTFVDKLIKQYRDKGKKVGVVCIDPSSPFTGGAVLGDRIRMMDHGDDDGVFIRSLGSRGAHGGLSRATRDVVYLMDAFGFDVILIETVGVGQTELDIMAVADTTLVVLVPESGDTIQTMKAGLMEIADIFVVNKADREGADKIFAELKALSDLFAHDDPIPVYKTEAFRNRGTDEVVAAIELHSERVKKGNVDARRMKGMLKEVAIDILMSEVQAQAREKLEVGQSYSKELESLMKDHHNPYLTAVELLKKLKWM